MYCPQCGKKFWLRNTFCPDCRVGLVEHPPAAAIAEQEADPTLALVFTTESAALVALAQSLLDAEQVEYMMEGAVLKDLFGGGAVRFWVRDADAVRAREILQDLRDTSQEEPSPRSEDEP